MISLAAVFIILSVHWIADFVCQSDWMALNKSKSMSALLTHTCVYTSIWILPCLMVSAHVAWIFLLITLVMHTLTDYVTSRANARFWAAEERYWFFVSVGLDQLLHYTQLLLTYYLLTKQ